MYIKNYCQFYNTNPNNYAMIKMMDSLVFLLLFYSQSFPHSLHYLWDRLEIGIRLLAFYTGLNKIKKTVGTVFSQLLATGNFPVLSL